MCKKQFRLWLTVWMVMCSSFAMAQEVLVSAAASLNNAFTEVGAAFEKQNSGVTVRFNFAGSGVLLRQIEQGAPVDVFASADQATMDRAQNQQLIAPESRFNFVENTLVLIVPKGAQVPVDIKNLQENAFRIIAIGTPSSVPAGSYAQQVLEEEQLWSVLQPKLVFGDNVRQVLQYMTSKEADAGFVYGTDAAISADKVQVALVLPTLNPITYPMAQVKASEHVELAQAFMQFVASEEGQKILARYGFVSPQAMVEIK